MLGLNSIEVNYEEMPESNPDVSLLATTLLMSFAAVGYGFQYLKNQMLSIKETKQDVDESRELEKSVYPSWNGTFADGENSLIVTLVKQQFQTKRENDEWVDWDGSEDASVITRNFYLGNKNPSFEWSIQKREFDVEAIVRETMIDGWDSVVQMKVTAYVSQLFETNTDMNRYLKGLFENGLIDWQKTTIDIGEYRRIFT